MPVTASKSNKSEQKRLEQELEQARRQIQEEVSKRQAAERIAGGLEAKLNPKDPVLKISNRQLYTELSAAEIFTMLKVPAIADAAQDVLRYAPKANRMLQGCKPAKLKLSQAVKTWVDDIHEKSGKGRTNYLVEEVSPVGRDSVKETKEDLIRIILKHKASVVNAALPTVNVSKDKTPRWRRIYITIRRYQLNAPTLF